MLTLLAAAALNAAPSPTPVRPARACASAAPVTTLPATIPVELWGNHVFLKACVGERELDFILDTGAGGTTLDLETAKQLGFKLGQTLAVGGAGPSHVAGARVEGATAAIAGTTLTQQVQLAIDMARLPPLEGHRIDGILGDDFIGRYVVAIDYARRELRIYDRDAFHYDGPGTSVPATMINAFPHIVADVRLGNGETVRGRMVIDVGSSGSLALTKTFVEERRLREHVVPTIHRTGGGGIGGTTTFDVGRVAALGIGGIELSGPIVSLFGDSAGAMTQSPSWDGNIGGAILRRFTLYLDYQGKRLIFEPNATARDPFEFDMSGITFRLDDELKTILVETVAPGSPAADAGLAHGDVIASVDGMPEGSQELAELRERLRRPGERVKFVVRRNGEERRVEIVTRRLI